MAEDPTSDQVAKVMRKVMVRAGVFRGGRWRVGLPVKEALFSMMENMPGYVGPIFGPDDPLIFRRAEVVWDRTLGDWDAIYEPA